MMWLQTASWELLLLWLCWTVEAVSAMTPVVAAGREDCRDWRRNRRSCPAFNGADTSVAAQFSISSSRFQL
jgi:hypothetical protein